MRKSNKTNMGTRIAGMREDVGRLPDEAAAVEVVVVVAVEDSVGLVPESVRDAVIAVKADDDAEGDVDIDDGDDVDEELDKEGDNEEMMLVVFGVSGKKVVVRVEAGDVDPPKDQPSPSGIDGP